MLTKTVTQDPNPVSSPTLASPCLPSLLVFKPKTSLAQWNLYHHQTHSQDGTMPHTIVPFTKFMAIPLIVVLDFGMKLTILSKPESSLPLTKNLMLPVTPCQTMLCLLLTTYTREPSSRLFCPIHNLFLKKLRKAESKCGR